MLRQKIYMGNGDQNEYPLRVGEWRCRPISSKRLSFDLAAHRNFVLYGSTLMTTYCLGLNDRGLIVMMGGDPIIKYQKDSQI